MANNSCPPYTPGQWTCMREYRTSTRLFFFACLKDAAGAGKAAPAPGSDQKKIGSGSRRLRNTGLSCTAPKGGAGVAPSEWHLLQQKKGCSGSAELIKKLNRIKNMKCFPSEAIQNCSLGRFYQNVLLILYTITVRGSETLLPIK